jgi:dTDP-4-amino-4,6-dideoxygalactose transaminase
MSTKEVKFLNLRKQYKSIESQIKEALHDVLESGSYSSGSHITKFEEAFAALHNAPYCCTVNSGTAALHVVMMALGISPGDEVIMPANTFFATPESVALCHATPVFVDCEDVYYNIDPSKIEEAITDKTKAIIAVHLYGQPAQMEKIKSIADKHNLYLIEDSAQAHLAEYKGQKIGTYGIAGCFSFYPGKNLGSYGEAGAVLVKDEELYKKIQAIKNHGSSVKYYHDYYGHNYRMESFQGAILNVKQKYIIEWTKKRQQIAKWYDKKLEGIPQIITPKIHPDCSHSYHLYVVQVPNRESFIKFLDEKGVQTGIHYPVPCHMHKASEGLNYKKNDFPNSEKLAQSIVSLPMCPELEEDDINYVAQVIQEFFHKDG